MGKSRHLGLGKLGFICFWIVKGLMEAYLMMLFRNNLLVSEGVKGQLKQKFEMVDPF